MDGEWRYAVLRHSGIEGEHFDFLFETSADGPLVTFRLEQWPVVGSGEATKLRDHRRVYLTYEGEVPGGRGRVDRVAEGRARIEREGEAWVLKRDDERAWLRFEPADGERWVLRGEEAG